MRKAAILLVALSACIPAHASGARHRTHAKHPRHRYSAFADRTREKALERILCADRELDCAYVRSLFSSPLLALTVPPPPTPTPPPPPPTETQHHRRERNPYLRERFGLLTPASLERCRGFMGAHKLAFNAAWVIYGVPAEVICGHLRIETNFGMVTPLTPHPLGTAPAFNRLVSLYVRWSSWRRRRFAVLQLKDLISAAEANGWDLFAMPGSSTGAIGLLQFEPSNFDLAVDGDGDGTVNLFSPDDAILSLAHYLYAHGWDGTERHDDEAIYSYYGRDPHRYYMKAVLAYAKAEKEYLAENPIVEPLEFLDVEPLKVKLSLNP